MAYIGREPTNSGEFLLIDNISGDFDGSETSFTLKVGTSKITPAAANTVIALDGVLQEPSSSYSISGSTITFGVSMSSSLTMNSFLHFGMGVSMTPTDGSVTTAKFASGVSLGSITDETQTFTNFNEITADRTTTLTTAKNYFLAGTITVADTFTWTIAGSGELNII